MLAALIFFFARTRRCAIVGSGTRNARAISGVWRPPRSRSVSATWALCPSAGWQHMKIRPSLSSLHGSLIPPLLVGVDCGEIERLHLPSWREASRRNRSIARFLAVVTIQPAGFGGTPVSGQRSDATRNASWTASSATSMSPKRRTRVAIAWPDSSRKTCSTVSAAADTGLLLRLVLERPHLDGRAAGDGRLAGPGQSGVEVGGLDDPEPAELLLRLGKGPSVRMISPLSCARRRSRSTPGGGRLRTPTRPRA